MQKSKMQGFSLEKLFSNLFLIYILWKCLEISILLFADKTFKISWDVEIQKCIIKLNRGEWGRSPYTFVCVCCIYGLCVFCFFLAVASSGCSHDVAILPLFFLMLKVFFMGGFWRGAWERERVWLCKSSQRTWTISTQKS